VGSYVFISYSSSDQAYVDLLVEHLQAHGLEVWIDARSIDYGSRWPTVIRDHINSCAAFIVVMTPSAEDSEWVGREIDQAQLKERPIRPLLLSGERFFRLAEHQFEDVRSGSLPTARFVQHLATLTAANSPASQPESSPRLVGGPDFAAWTCTNVLRDHYGAILALAVAPSGEWLVSAGMDHIVRFWNPRSGRQLRRRLEGHTDMVCAVAVAPSGEWLASASTDGTVRIWDARSGRELRRFDGHTDVVDAVAVAPSGEWLVSGSHDGTTRVWDVASGRQRRCLTIGRREDTSVYAVAVAPSGEWLVSAHSDSTLRIWDPSSGRQLRRLDGHVNAVFGVAVAPSGKWLASASLDHTVRIWDAASGRQRHRLNGHTEPVVAVAVAPSGKWLASSDRHVRNNTVRIWDARSGRELRRLDHADSVDGVVVAPSGEWLASCSDAVRIWR